MCRVYFQGLHITSLPYLFFCYKKGLVHVVRRKCHSCSSRPHDLRNLWSLTIQWYYPMAEKNKCFELRSNNRDHNFLEPWFRSRRRREHKMDKPFNKCEGYKMHYAYWVQIRCVNPEEGDLILKETYEGICGYTILDPYALCIESCRQTYLSPIHHDKIWEETVRMWRWDKMIGH